MSQKKIIHIVLSILAAILLHFAVVHPILDLVTVLSFVENLGAICIESCMVYEVTKYFFQGWKRSDKVLACGKLYGKQRVFLRCESGNKDQENGQQSPEIGQQNPEKRQQSQ